MLSEMEVERDQREDFEVCCLSVAIVLLFSGFPCRMCTLFGLKRIALFELSVLWSLLLTLQCLPFDCLLEFRFFKSPTFDVLSCRSWSSFAPDVH